MLIEDLLTLTSLESRASARQDPVRAGDVVAARHAARALLADPSTPEDVAQAGELLRRSTTPRALYGHAALAAACFVLLVLLASSRYS